MNETKTMRNLLIFGDSYSTFAGYIPEGYAAYYSTAYREQTDVRRLKDIDKRCGHPTIRGMWDIRT